MAIQRHGISLGIERINDDIYMTFKVIGKLTHADYETITPMLESAVSGIEHPKIKALIDCTELEGWELRAAWDDLKLGLKHGREFSKIALYGNENWQEFMTKIASWFISGDAKFFEEQTDALAWLRE